MNTINDAASLLKSAAAAGYLLAGHGADFPESWRPTDPSEIPGTSAWLNQHASELPVIGEAFKPAAPETALGRTAHAALESIPGALIGAPEEVAAQLAARILGGTASGAGSQSVAEAGGGPVPRVVAGILGGLVGGAVVGRVAPDGKPPSLESPIDGRKTVTSSKLTAPPKPGQPHPGPLRYTQGTEETDDAGSAPDTINTNGGAVTSANAQVANGGAASEARAIGAGARDSNDIPTRSQIPVPNTEITKKLLAAIGVADPTTGDMTPAQRLQALGHEALNKVHADYGINDGKPTVAAGWTDIPGLELEQIRAWPPGLKKGEQPPVGARKNIGASAEAPWGGLSATRRKMAELPPLKEGDINTTRS